MDAPSFLPPNIVIVGRPNVGKSTLINAICGRRVVITDATPGTTRDRVSIRARHSGVPFNIIDTGGITDEVGSPIDTAVRHQVDLALAQAAVVVFVCDVRDGVTSIDREIAEMLRKCGRPVVVCANKVDSQRHESTAGEFFGLGFGAPVLISAVQRLSISDLLDRVFAVLHIDAVAIRQQLRGTKHLPPMKLAIVGRQNVGKSTLVNALAGEERVIVSEIAGTTRDSVDVSFQWQGHEFIAIDTAGLRKKGRVEDPIEYHSRMRTDVSIKRADVVLFLIDSAMRVTDVDKKIAGEVDEMAKPVVIGINKYDLVEEHNETKKLVDMNDYSKYISRTLPTLAYAPISLISALRGKNVFETVSTALDLYTQAHERIPTSQLNQVIERAKDWPGPRARHRGKAKIYYATQTRVAPPTIVLFVNDPALFPDDYRRNLANKFRAEMIYPEIPIRLEFAKHRKGAGKRKERSAEPEEPYESETPPAAASPSPRPPADAVAETPREDPS